MSEIRLRTGSVTGRDHLARRVNCQDASGWATTKEAVVAVVCDGCGSGENSEVGAKLAAQYLSAEAARLLESGRSYHDTVRLLYPRLVSYLSLLTTFTNPQNTVDYVRQNMLFTVVGFIVSRHGGVAFSAGDGLIMIDEARYEMDQNNRPDYPAYHLVCDSLPADYNMSADFEIYHIPADWERLCVATDGFEPELLPEIWGQAHPRGLQRRMNVWSDQQRRFRDDATIITCERLYVEQPEVES